MKRINLGLLLLAIAGMVYAQAPNAFNYQAVLRNTDGTVKANETVSLQISLIDDAGSSAYIEIHNTQTNELGLINVVIGEGVTSEDLSVIDWSAKPYYLDITVNGENLGSSPLLSVPYAMYAETANRALIDNVVDGDADPENEIQKLSLSNQDLTISGEGGNTTTFTNWDTDSSNDVITTSDQIIEGNKTFLGTTTVNYPINSTDATNKSYVDDVTEGILTDFQIVQSFTTNIFSGFESYEHTTSCPDGMTAIGGGVSSWSLSGTTGLGNVNMMGSASTGSGWRVMWYNASDDGGITARFTVQAVCVRVN